MKHFITLLVLICVSPLFGQDFAISWANNHPGVTILSADNYASLSNQSKQLLGEKVLVYQHQLTQQDILLYEHEQENLSLPFKSENAEVDQLIKNWLAVNTHRKCVPLSVHTAFSAEEVLFYTEKGALFLIGEELTLEDIINN